MPNFASFSFIENEVSGHTPNARFAECLQTAAWNLSSPGIYKQNIEIIKIKQ